MKHGLESLLRNHVVCRRRDWVWLTRWICAAGILYGSRSLVVLTEWERCASHTHTQIPLKNSAPDLLSFPVHGKTVKVLLISFPIPFHISFFVSYARSESNQSTHTVAHKQQFFFLPSLFTHASMNFSRVFFSHLQVMSDLKNLSLRDVYILASCWIFLSSALLSISLAAGSHRAEQTNTRHQLRRSVNIAPARRWINSSGREVERIRTPLTAEWN